MASVFIVLVRHHQWRVVRFQGKKYQELRVFPGDTQGQVQLLDWLKSFAKSQVSFLTDIPEEHYHVELLPPVRGSARKQLLARRLAAWPFSRELHAVHRVDTVQNARPEDRYLFSAIHCPPLSTCLQNLEQQGISIQGIYTQSLCLPGWIPSMENAHQLCVQVEREHVRIHYLFTGRLLFSRQLPLSHDIAFAPWIVNELAKIRLYLVHQHWLPESGVLHLLWMGNHNFLDDLPELPLPEAATQTRMTYEELIQANGWRLPVEVNAAEWAAIQILLNHPHVSNLAPYHLLLPAQVARDKRHIRWACFATLCLSVMAGWSNQQALQYTQFEIANTRTTLQQLQADLPAMQFAESDGPELQMFSNTVSALAASARLPHRALELLEDTLAEVESWQLDKMEWRYEPVDQAGESGQAVTGWSEAILIHFSRHKEAVAIQAHHDWQHLMHKLQAHPETLRVTEIRETAIDNQMQGDTRELSMDSDQHALKVHMRTKEQK